MNVLLIQEDPSDVRRFRKMLTASIASLFIDLEVCATLPDALLEIPKKHFEIVLLDLTLRDPSGERLFEIVRSSAPNSAVIVLTGPEHEELAVKLIQIGAQDYLIKGEVTQREFLRAIRYAVEHRRRELELKEKTKALLDLESAREKLHLSHEVLQKVGTLVLMVDKHGRVTYANPHVQAALGYKVDEVLGDGWWRLTGDPGKPNAELEYARNAARGDVAVRAYPYERDIRAADGSIRRILWQDNLIGEVLVGIGQDVTELKRAEQRFASAFNSNPLPKLIARTSDGCILDANGAFLRVCDLSREEVIGRKTQEVGLRLDPALLDDDQRCVSEYELPLTLGRGSNRIWNVFVDTTILSNEPCLLMVLQDITERKAYESALRESEARFRSVFEEAATGIALSSLDGRFLRINPFWCSLLGYTEEELLRLTWHDITLPEDRHRTIEGRESLLKGTIHSFHVEKRYLHKSGRVVWVLLSAALVRDASGNPLYFVSQVQDITGRNRAEEALEASAHRFKAVFDGSRDAMAITDDLGICLDINAAGALLFGMEKEHLLGRRIQEYPRVDNDYEACWKAFQLGRQIGFFSIRNEDQTKRTIEFSASANFVPGQHLALMRDVTERRSLEEQLRQSQKMEAVGNLAGGIAHDFNNLLGIIGGYLELLQVQLPKDSPYNRYVEKATASVGRAASLTKQLLAFGRKQVLTPNVLNLNLILEEMGRMLPRLIGEDIELTITSDPSLGLVKVDRTQVEQVLLNLVVNARDAMPEGGRLMIETKNVEVGPEYTLAHSVVPAGSYVLVCVSDTGTGMDEATRSRIFEPFFTTKEMGKGTGLGLSTTYGIVKQSGGYIWVYSELGLGTSFKIYLPRVNKAGTPEEAPAVPPPATVCEGDETILIAEDEDDLRIAMAQYLERFGYTVFNAKTGPEALELLAKGSAPIDLLITDVVMPKMNGRELAEKITALRPSVQVIFISGYTDDVVLRRGILASGVHFMQKPFNLNALGKKIREVIPSSRTQAAKA